MGQQQCDLTRQGMSENVLLDDNKGPDHAFISISSTYTEQIGFENEFIWCLGLQLGFVHLVN